MKHPKSAEGKLVGLQLALFETVWPAFEWIESVLLDGSNAQERIRVRFRSLPAPQDWAECQAIVREVLDAAGMHRRTPVLLEPADTVGQSLPIGCTELISDKLFKSIAQEVAPWRLEVGR